MTEPIILTPSQCKIANVVWDLAWRNDRDVRKLALKFKGDGPTVFQAICCEIGLAGGFIENDDLEVIAAQIWVNLETVRLVVKECGDLGMLEVTEYGITSSRMQREIERTMKMKIQKKQKDAILVFPWTALNEQNPPGGEIVPPRGETSPPSKPSQGEESRGEIKPSTGKPRSEIPHLPLPTHLETPERRHLVNSWQAKCALQKYYLDEITWEAQLTPYSSDPARLDKALIHSTGLIKNITLRDPEEARAGPPKKQTKFERNMAVIQGVLNK